MSDLCLPRRPARTREPERLYRRPPASRTQRPADPAVRPIYSHLLRGGEVERRISCIRYPGREPHISIMHFWARGGERIGGVLVFAAHAPLVERAIEAQRAGARGRMPIGEISTAVGLSISIDVIGSSHETVIRFARCRSDGSRVGSHTVLRAPAEIDALARALQWLREQPKTNHQSK